MASSSDLEEFDLIERYFAPLAGEAGLGLLDDAACFAAPTGKDLVITKDLLVAGTHFFPDDKPADVALKALTVNISDLAAKGATPVFYMLGLSLPKNILASWLEAFSEGLKSAQELYAVELIGGDTTSTQGPVTLSITAIGYVESGQMIKRSGARQGDKVFVSGSLGGAALALAAIKGDIKVPDIPLDRYYRPLARHELGAALCGVATAAADISDGLLADLGHICKASSVPARIFEAHLPLSEDSFELVKADPSLWPLIWSGGDDYELVFTVPIDKVSDVEEIARAVGISVTCIGDIGLGTAVELVDSEGKLVQASKSGYQHFGT